MNLSTPLAVVEEFCVDPDENTEWGIVVYRNVSREVVMLDLFIRGKFLKPFVQRMKGLGWDVSRNRKKRGLQGLPDENSIYPITARHKVPKPKPPNDPFA
jgi:hypothetical protein